MLRQHVKLINNTSWLLASEIAAKISRIAVIFALAASLTAIEYGTAMLALACHEIFKIILRSGAGSQIIQCESNLLPSYAQNGALIQWVVCFILATTQATLALPLSHFYNNPELFTTIALMAVVYLVYPIVSVRVFLVQRANKMRFYSIRNALCILAENLSIAIFAMLDCGILSVVYGKWVFASLWVVLFYFSPVESFGVSFQFPIFVKLCKTSGQLLCTELVRALRLQMDMLIGARLLSPELFGLYCFAKSAGVGLSQSLNNAFNAGLYPLLCDKNRNKSLKNYIPTVYLFTAGIAALFIVQALLVPYYVPLLFKQSWQQNHLVIILLCLAALPAIFIDTQCNILRAKAAFQSEFKVRLFCLFTTFICLSLFQASDPESFAYSILFSSVIWLVAMLPINSIKQFLFSPVSIRS
ncbi:oligosaccharide flippase family protein [Paraglaciecola sp.]|uniref:oligosaccharide flippase family protein n=1 Tax=Paraglaciecola sp. TaxID=1920173 RepID=UPI003EF6F842